MRHTFLIIVRRVGDVGAHISKLLSSLASLFNVILVGVRAIFLGAGIQITGVTEIGQICLGGANAFDILAVSAGFGILAAIVGQRAIVVCIQA